MNGTRASTILALALVVLAVPTSAADDAGRAGPSEPGICTTPVPSVTIEESAASHVPSATVAELVASPGPSGGATPIPGPVGPDLSRGRWAQMARAPFGSEYEPVAWTGRQLVAFDRDSGRTAAYAPSRDRWREVARAPRRFGSTARSTWSEGELIVLEISADGRTIGGAVYDPGRDRWRRTARLETGFDDGNDHQLTEPVWTGGYAIVADSFGLLAAYDPAADCWVELGRVPGDPWVWHLYAAGPVLLVESRRPDEPVELRALDLATMTWSEPVAGPLTVEASEGGGAWIDRRLVYVTWYSLDGGAGAGNAIFDPATMTWSAFEHECATSASGTLAVEAQLVSSDGRRALDGRTLTCVELPPAPRRLNGTERLAWTGRELIAWSGIRSLPEGARHGGLIFRPTGAR